MGVSAVGERVVSLPFSSDLKTMNYQKVWNVMNDLEMVTCKIASAREILDSAMDRLQEHQYDKTETLLCAVDEFLQYYLSEFDTKFKDAWKETVIQLKKEEIETLHYTDDEMDSMCAAAEEEELISKGYFKDKVVKWILPIEEVDCDECIINFPDDLLEAANLKEGDEVEWVDRGDGSFLIRKISNAEKDVEILK